MRSLPRRLMAGSILCLLAAAGARADDVQYTYDALGRLIRVQYVGGPTTVYNYDAAGNRTSVVYGAGNSAPIAVADPVTTRIRRPLTRFDPRKNDTDADSDPLTITSVNTPNAEEHGTVVINSGQTITYTPDSTFPSGPSDTDDFSYTIDDGNGHTATALVTVTVTDVPPTAVADTFGVDYNAVAAQLLPLGNDSDPDGAGDVLSISAPTGTAVATQLGGTVKRLNATTLSYTAPHNVAGDDHFDYTITDGHQNAATAHETVHIAPQNQPPVAHDDSGNYTNTQVQPGHPVKPVITLDPRINDTDPDGETLTVTAVTQPSQAHAAVSFSGTSVTYSWNQFVGNLEVTDSFTYTVSDQHGHSDTATVGISITVETEANGGQ